MEIRPSLSFDVIGIVGIILTIVFLVLDKAGKLRGGLLVGLLCLAGVMTLFLAIGNHFVLDAPAKWRVWLGLLIFSLVAFTYSGLAIWISEDSTEAKEAPFGPVKSDIGVEFIKGTSPGIALTSLSDAIVRDPTCTVEAWNLDTKTNLPAFNQSEAGMFVKKGNGILVASLDNPNMRPHIKTGDKIFGLITVDCPDCLETKRYWLFVVYGGESWYSLLPRGAAVNTLDINRRLIAVNWDVEEFMKQVPHGERLAPKIY